MNEPHLSFRNFQRTANYHLPALSKPKNSTFLVNEGRDLLLFRGEPSVPETDLRCFLVDSTCEEVPAAEECKLPMTIKYVVSACCGVF